MKLQQITIQQITIQQYRFFSQYNITEYTNKPNVSNPSNK